MCSLPMRWHIVSIAFLLSVVTDLKAQQNVGIGTTSPDSSAVLDIQSSDKGILIPRLSTAQRVAIPSPANGLLVFDTDAHSLYNYHENAWHRIALPEDGIPGDFLQINSQNAVQWLPFLDRDALPPPEPEEIGDLTLGGTLGFMKIRGNYVYLLDSGADSLLVIDISDKTAPFLRGQVTVAPYPQSLEVIGQYAYIGDRDLNQLFVLQIADPDSMYSVDTIPIGDLPTEMVYAMGHLYIIDQVDNNLRTFDLSDPAHPVEVSNTTLPATDGITRLKAQGDLLYYIMGGVLGAIDISLPQSPQIKGTLGIHNATISLSVDGPYAYTVNHQQDLFKIYNVSDPDSFFFVGSAPTDQFVLDIDAKNRFAFIVGQTSDLLRISDVSEPSAPQEVATIPAGSVPNQVQVHGNYVYVIDGGSDVLRIFRLGEARIVSANMMGEIEQVTDLSEFSAQWAKNGDIIYNTNNGFVGIGTSTPEQKLDIRGGGPDDAALVMLGNGDTSHYLLLFPGRQNDPEPFIRWKAGDALRFGTDENIFSARMRIESNGNVGIGVSVASVPLHVLGNLRVDSGELQSWGPVALHPDVDVSGDDAILFLDNSGAETARFHTNGNFGFGTANPLTPVSITPSTTGAKLTLWDGGIATDHYGFGISANQLNYHTAGDSASHVFYAGGKNGDGAERMRVTGDGRVGIRISEPYAALHVIGGGQTGSMIIAPDFSFSGNSELIFTENYGNPLYGMKIQYNGTEDRLDFIRKSLDTYTHLMTMDRSTGFVGIGNTDPQTTLEIEVPFGTTSTTSGIQWNTAERRWRMTVGGANAGTGHEAYFQVLYRNHDAGSYTPRLTIAHTGEVAIGSAAVMATGHLLSVDGKIACEEVRVEASDNWPDYVFTSGYVLRPLDEVKKHIAEEGRLPGFPAAGEIEANGFELGEMQRKMMEKIEELTLYILQQEEKMQSLQKQLDQLRSGNE